MSHRKLLFLLFLLCLFNLTLVNARAVGRFENPGVPVSFGGHNRPPLVEIGLLICQNLGASCPPHGSYDPMYAQAHIVVHIQNFVANEAF